MRTLYTTLLLSLLTSPLYAAENKESTDAPPPPPMAEQPADTPQEAPPPPAAAEDQEMQPEVTIFKRKEETIEEYRLNGRLYMVKITPSKGYPYYLIDTDGDGSLETRRNELDNPPVVQWRLFEW